MSKSIVLRHSCMIAAAGLLPLSVANLASGLWPPVDLLASFRLQYAFCASLLFLVSLWKRYVFTAIMSFLSVIVNVTLVVPLYLRDDVGAEVPSDQVRILHINAWKENLRTEDVLALIRSSKAEIVSLQEITEPLHNGLAELADVFTILDAKENALLFRTGPLAPVIVRWQEIILEERPCIEVLVRIGIKDLSILAVHTWAPLTLARVRARDKQFMMIADWYCRQDVPAVVVGDLNATPWSACFRSLLHATGMLDSEKGYGIQATWPVRPVPWLAWMARIPIDHCLHGPELRTLARSVGPDCGSNHLPLSVTLGWR